MSIPLFLLTFNCGKLKLNADAFTEHLLQALPDSPPDLFVFGFQEICSILDGSFPHLVRKHVIDINRVLIHALKTKYNEPENSGLAFTTIGVHHVGAIAMIAVTPYVLRFGTCKFASASCGYANSLMKGGVGIRVSYTSPDAVLTELTFATAHLSAFEGHPQYERRLMDVQTLMRAMDFKDGHSFLKPDSHAFFMGDLNFRTTQDPKFCAEDLREVQNTEAQSDHISSLVAKHDELTHGRVNGEVFAGFDEACIEFRPTYKFHLNTAIYNTKRCPLWCDRILYQSTYKKGAAPVVHAYNSVQTYLGPDHRPVYLQITIPLEAPELIIGDNGYLVVLPVALHLEHNSQIKDFDPNRTVSGPTQVYMKFTALDQLNQHISRPTADFTIGWGLWFGTTSRGRISMLALTLLAWVLYAI
ncbi:hypothetical protein HF325_002112 [Metschnikowia pulcherrima]|uniref:Inositol polyphosphate-related phosphatase domain-containing protein n=1 Tax=Metschnikowia pulcherrima TaxID=27326 RepID=A0A8H7GTT2_9ASCO|nr:hypothetical protein HF325_002112 [Metschnikowia pulcherrima]